MIEHFSNAASIKTKFFVSCAILLALISGMGVFALTEFNAMSKLNLYLFSNALSGVVISGSVVGRTVAEAVPEAAEQGFIELLDTVYRTGQPFAANGVRYAAQLVAGGPVDEHYIDFVYQPIKDPGGAVSGVF